MKLSFVCCAESGALDRESNRISLFNILPSLRIPANRFPANLVKMMIGFSGELEANEPTSQSVNIEIDTGSTSLSEQIPVEFGVHTTFQGLVRVNNVIIPKPGEIRIRILQNGKSLGESSCKVLAGPAIEEEPPPPLATAAVEKSTSPSTKADKATKRRHPA